jgi:SpoVK/Ycf46/Vps4 family AAA+-type ATPase
MLSDRAGVEVRLRQLTRLFTRTPLAPDVELADVARKTASFVGRELRSLHAHAAATALTRVVRGSDQVRAAPVLYDTSSLSVHCTQR